MIDNEVEYELEHSKMSTHTNEIKKLLEDNGFYNFCFLGKKSNSALVKDARFISLDEDELIEYFYDKNIIFENERFYVKDVVLFLA